MDVIEAYLKAQRNKSFSNSPQLSLGEIIKRLESCELKNDDGKAKEVDYDYDFASAIPTTLDSWRGSYSELALGFKLSGHDNNEEHFSATTAEFLLNELKNAIGKTYQGWKGGDFQMNMNTPVWVANPGNSGDTGIIDVIDDGCRILLMTTYCEY